MDALELDEAGNVVSEYKLKASRALNEQAVSVAIKSIKEPIGVLQSLVNVFLPAGYPHSVSEDYLEYQIYDSLQAFSSSIAGLLSSRAVLQGVGVGDSNASATAAVLLNILQDSIGRLATILFAWRLGTSLEPECKRYRYAADIFNDTALILDCLSPALPKPLRIATLCVAGCMRALCGVAGGGSKASLSVHFAKWGNVGELNAKDSSQETVISLMGMLAGSLVVSHIISVTATWFAMLFLIGVHLWTNYRAVRAVTMRTLNRQRANIVASHYFASKNVLNPKAVATRERIFEADGLLRWNGKNIGWGIIGSLGVLIAALGPQGTGATKLDSGVKSSIWQQLVDLFNGEEYIVWYDKSRHGFIACLKENCSTIGQLKAWSHGLLLVHKIMQIDQAGRSKALGPDAIFDAVQQSKEQIDLSFSEIITGLEESGWNLEGSTMEATSGNRIRLIDSEKKEI